MNHCGLATKCSVAVPVANYRRSILGTNAVDGNASLGAESVVAKTEDSIGESLIVVNEVPLELKHPSYPWPENIERRSHGLKNAKPSRVFQFCLAIIRRAKPNFEWIPIYKDESGFNAIAKLPALSQVLNSLFKDQLQAEHTESQRSLLHEADVVLICYDPKNDSILSYGSNKFSEKGSIPNVLYQVIHMGHMIVAVGHEKEQLTPLTGVTMGLYGHSFLDLFRTEIVVIRSNNRYVERIISRVPTIYRSDKLSDNEADARIREVVKAIKWTDKHVFHSKEDLTIGKPSKISHRFPQDVTIDGLKTDEIVYLARISSIGLYALRIMKSAFKRKSRR